MTDRNTIHALKQVLTEGFDLEELHDICFRLNIDKDELPSTTKTSFINALLDLIDKHNQIPDLLETGRTLRDQLDWPQLPSERLRTLKQAIGQKESEAVDEIFPELIAYIKRLEKQGINEIDETLLEMFGKGDIPGTKLVHFYSAITTKICAPQWYIHGRPRYAKLSIDDFKKVKIAAIHPDFV